METGTEFGQGQGQGSAPVDPNRQQNYFARQHRSKSLPPPHELAARVEEARTSAKLLLQVVQSTPPGEFLNNDLIKEFADRCQSASRTLQAYIHADNPAPDNDTLQNLIDTNDQLTMAMSKHQRAVLHVRRALAVEEVVQAQSVPPAPAAPVVQQQQQQQQQPQDPFRDDNQVNQPPLQAPLQPALDSPNRQPIQDHERYGTTERTVSAESHPSPVSTMHAHPQEPYHPGYGYSPRDHPAGTQQSVDANQQPLDYSRWADDADYYSANNRRTDNDGRDPPRTHDNNPVMRGGAGN